MSAVVLPSVTPRNVEAIKWLAFATMLADHWDLFVTGGQHTWAAFLGGLPLPLFAIALGVTLAPRTWVTWERVVVRLVIWAGISQAALLLVRESMPLNVLATIVCGIGLAMAVHRPMTRTSRILLAGFALGFGHWCEGGVIGVAVFATSLIFFKTRSVNAGMCWAGSVVLLSTLSGYGTLLALPLAYWLNGLENDLPRVRHFFYVGYAAQWPLLAALAAVG